jgi:hypothetical protein
MAKTPISLRLEADLLDWFKDIAPKGYQVLIQQVLRDYRSARENRKQQILGRAQQVFMQYYAKCFWHLRRDLQVTDENLSIIQNGLRKYGGLEGMRLAAELELK